MKIKLGELEKEFNLRPINSRKYCLSYKEIVNIVMNNLDGFCPNENCGKKLFTLNPKTKNGR